MQPSLQRQRHPVHQESTSQLDRLDSLHLQSEQCVSGAALEEEFVGRNQQGELHGKLILSEVKKKRGSVAFVVEEEKPSSSFRLRNQSAFTSLSGAFSQDLGVVASTSNRTTFSLSRPMDASDRGSVASSASSSLRRELDEERNKRLAAEEQLRLTQELLERIQNGAKAIQERAVAEDIRANQALEAARKAEEEKEEMQRQMRELQEQLRQNHKSQLERTSQYKTEITGLYDELQLALQELKEQQDETTAVSSSFLEFVKYQQARASFVGRTPSPSTNALLDEHWDFVNKHKTPAKEPEEKATRWSHRSHTPSSADSTSAFKSIFRLPKQLIEKFDGDPRKWPNFIAAFKEATRGMSPAERMAVLRQLLTEDVRNSLGDILNNPDMCDQAIHELENTYGNPHMVSRSYIRTLLHMSKVQNLSDYNALLKMSNTIRGAVSSLRAGGYGYELTSGTTLEMMLDKIPS